MRGEVKWSWRQRGGRGLWVGWEGSHAPRVNWRESGSRRSKGKGALIALSGEGRPSQPCLGGAKQSQPHKEDLREK